MIGQLRINFLYLGRYQALSPFLEMLGLKRINNKEEYLTTEIHLIISTSTFTCGHMGIAGTSSIIIASNDSGTQIHYINMIEMPLWVS